MNVVWFDQHARANEIGGKGFRLCRLAQAGLPVPRGFCIPADDLDRVTADDIEQALSQLGAKSVAVRSSAVQEDDAFASFAGIYISRLNLGGVEEILSALDEVRTSAASAAAIAYRHRRGIREQTRMAAIVQEFVNSEASGVLFMKDPVDAAPRIIVEGSWGLGEAVAGGLVTPDRWILSLDGDVITTMISDKDLAVVPYGGGTREVEIEFERRRRPCLDQKLLGKLFQLSKVCEKVLGAPQDIEWATAMNNAWLLQSRPISAISGCNRGRS